MSAYEIDITDFFNEACPRDYSASQMELGPTAGRDTWRAANEDSDTYALLRTEEEREAFRSFVRSSGGWSEEEIAAWPDAELNALCIQWVAGDMRESDLGPESTDEDWTAYEQAEFAGLVSSRISRATDGRVYFYVGV